MNSDEERERERERERGRERESALIALFRLDDCFAYVKKKIWIVMAVFT